MSDVPVPEQWREQYEWKPMGASKARQCIEELGAAESQLAIERQNCTQWEQAASVHEQGLRAMTADRDLWASDHEEDCPNLTLLELAREEKEALEGQVVRLKEALRDIKSLWGKKLDARDMWVIADAALADSPESQEEPAE